MKRIEYQQGCIINGVKFIHEVTAYIAPTRKKHRRALFECGCGNQFESLIESVKSGNTQSCGCLAIARLKDRATHGMTITTPYRKWQTMISRCYYKKRWNYHNYGGRGITVCSEWRHDFAEFYRYIKALPNAFKEGYSIDRINNDGNYEPGNIKWSTRSEQQRNKRKYKKRIRSVA